MTDSNRALNEVPALLEERHRFESWLAALDARRGSTPEHVFERVQADYRGRLQRVDQQLASHRQAIEEERANVQSRVSLLEAEERMRRDERAELELRAHVGELAGSDADSAFREVDDTIKQLVDERESLAHRVADLDTLLAPRTPSPPPEAPAIAAPAEPSAPAEAAPAPAAPAAMTSTATAPSVQRTSGRPRTPTGSFDELAFLNTVVGEGDPPAPRGTAAAAEVSTTDSIVRDEAVAASLVGGLDPSADEKGEPPLAANVTANHPIVLKTAPSGEQAKTLKCNECGSMNYPTEWYCERCGAELAAL